MTMRMLTIFQFTEVMCVYLLMTVGLPAFVLRTKIRERSLTEKFIICFLVGNFYIMNLVFILELLRISNQITLCLGTVLPAFFAWLRLNEIKLLPRIHGFWKEVHRLADGHLGVKTVVYRTFGGLKRNINAGLAILARSFCKRWLEWIFVIAILMALGSFYGVQLLRSYGYTASDTPVHLFWVNGLEQNKIFIDGVYPFGYHCIIYYIHKVFNIDSYVMMRVFSFVQTIMIHLVLLAFIKLCTKSKYIAYAVVGIFVLGNLLQSATFFRYFAVLPQEYGMLFILPSIYYAFRFFQCRRRELRFGLPKSESALCLAFFAMSFSMTLAVHFYDTMIAGLFCAGVAAGYLFLFLRKQYFWSVVNTCILAVFIAVLPMGIAFATGTPLQGSLGWGMSVINGEGEEEGAKKTAEELNVVYYDANGKVIDKTDDEGESVEKEKTLIKEGVLPKLARAWYRIGEAVRYLVLNDELPPWCYQTVLAAVGGLFVLGAFFFLFRQRCYGAMLLSTGVFMIIMLVLQAAKNLGLPELMDYNRCRIYFAYMLPVVFGFVIDGIIRLIIWPKNWSVLRNLVSLALVAAVIVHLWDGDNRKELIDNTPLVTNEAILCLTNIIEDEDDFTWTIVSANDETQMSIDHGYHYEIISLLREMEYRNMDADADPFIEIPTSSVYVFVEKVPIDYTVEYENSGQTVSKQGAIRELPSGGGIEMYTGENRWIVMSRVYYWAQEMERMYPNDVKVYCETDTFVCYKINQNINRLFNFAIDYGYNSRKVRG